MLVSFLDFPPRWIVELPRHDPGFLIVAGPFHVVVHDPIHYLSSVNTRAFCILVDFPAIVRRIRSDRAGVTGRKTSAFVLQILYCKSDNLFRKLAIHFTVPLQRQEK
jgi:hypothetical protein